MITVPEPLPDDPEAVVTALETAEIFGKQGDVKEAVRWVRRAAEIAGDEGNDLRALNLARAVAELNISSSQGPEPPPPPPPPPLPRGGATSDDPDSDAETRVVDSQSVLAEYEKQAQASARGNGAAPTAAAVEAATDLTKDAMPEGETVTRVMPEAAELAKSVEESTPVSKRGLGSMAELLARKEAEAIAAAEAAHPADAGRDNPPPPPPAQPSVMPQGIQASTPPVERRTARPIGERIATPLIPSQPHSERPTMQAPIHQAVRASVVATAEPGVYVLRVLAAGQTPAPTAQEVFVVVTDPSLSPFARK